MNTLYSTDTEVLESAIEWLDAGLMVALVTVVRTWRSSPRPAGALMLIETEEPGVLNDIDTPASL